MESGLIFDYNQYQAFPDFHENEMSYVQYLAGTLSQQTKAVNAAGLGSNLSKEIQKAREQIKSSLNDAAFQSKKTSGSSSNDVSRIEKLEKNNAELLKMVNSLMERVSLLEKQTTKTPQPTAPTKTAPVANGNPPVPDDDDDDADENLFASSDEDDGDKEKLKADRVSAYQDRKAKKPALIAKSQIILDVKPWDDETDMSEMEKLVRSIQTDGLLWGTSKLVPLAYGIKKLQICCVVEDDKVGTDFLEEEITKFETHIQSVDIAAFQKI